jgi:oxaloacetate decarboxylase alpha subunit/pyruvate carboxylase subunit B
MPRKLLVRDVTLRDGQQSLFATRMTQQQINRVLPIYREANFYAMEVWGGAIPDSIMRYLNEDPWVRLETIKREIGDVSKLTALSRGRNLFGYNPYPESVIEGFNRNAVKSGISIMRIFDALNDASNIRSTIKYVKENGGIADCTVCYTVDPKFTHRDKIKAILRGKQLPSNIFTIDYFVKMAKELEAMGADMITLKDMAGLIPPSKAGQIIRALKSNVKIPIDFHTHCTPGYGLGAFVMALVNGVDILDTAILNFSGGPAAPSFEIIQLFCNKLDIETGVNLDAVVKINKELKVIREELSSFDSYKIFPIDFDITKDTLPVEIDNLFNQAVAAAKADDESALLKACYGIEKYFNFPEPDEVVKFAEVPGGMYTNMLAQLKQLQLEKLLPRVMEIIPTVRLAAGCPPLVTPTSQIVGAQAVNCIIDENKGLPFYTSKSIQFVNLVKGSYGKTPIPVDPDFRMKIAGVREEIPYNTDSYERQPNLSFPQYGPDVVLAKNEKEELLLELFPAVATKYLEDKIHAAGLEVLLAAERERNAKREEENQRIANMTPEERLEMITTAMLNW